MRWIVSLIALVGAAASATASDVQFVRVWPQWHDADWFDRIGEYFGRPESARPERILRSHPDVRAGMYFLVRVKSAQPIGAAKFVLEVIRPDAPDPKTFTFPVTLPRKSGVAELGLTDGDWPGGRSAHAVAWRITLMDGAGRTLASEQSYLWAKPSR